MLSAFSEKALKNIFVSALILLCEIGVNAFEPKQGGENTDNSAYGFMLQLL